jgi:hypothetical protein
VHTPGQIEPWGRTVAHCQARLLPVMVCSLLCRNNLGGLGRRGR